jgi:hypothetical protein
MKRRHRDSHESSVGEGATGKTPSHLTITNRLSAMTRPPATSAPWTYNDHAARPRSVRPTCNAMPIGRWLSRGWSTPIDAGSGHNGPDSDRGRWCSRPGTVCDRWPPNRLHGELVVLTIDHFDQCSGHDFRSRAWVERMLIDVVAAQRVRPGLWAAGVASE